MGFYSHTKSSFFCCHDDNKKEPNNPSDSAKSKYIFFFFSSNGKRGTRTPNTFLYDTLAMCCLTIGPSFQNSRTLQRSCCEMRISAILTELISNGSHLPFDITASAGFEPTLSESKSDVLPNKLRDNQLPLQDLNQRRPKSADLQSAAIATMRPTHKMTPVRFELNIYSLRDCRPNLLDEGAIMIPAGLEPSISALKGLRPNL